MEIIKRKLLSKIAMLLLALSPVLSQYGSFLNYAVLSLLMVVIFLILQRENYYIPKRYDFYWLWVAISYLIVTLKPAALIPGGLSFFTFSIIVIYLVRQFNFYYFRLFFRILALISIGLFVGQEVMWYTTGARFVPFLNLGPLTTTLTYQQLIYRNLFADRSASIFLEPAHFANFLLIALALETFTTQRKQFFTKFGFLVVFSLLLLRSGTGLAGLAVIVLFRMRSYTHHFSAARRIIVSATIVLAIGGAMYIYSGTNVGEEMFKRSQNELTLDEEGHSYGRFVTGTVIYAGMPLANQIIGISDEDLLPIAKRYTMYQRDTSEEANVLYMNGWAYSMTHTGIIGFTLLIWVLIGLYRNNNDVSKCLIWLFVVLSLFGQTYTTPFMMMVIIISAHYQTNKKRIQTHG